MPAVSLIRSCSGCGLPSEHGHGILGEGDANLLGEVEMLCDSPVNNGAVRRGSTVVKLVPGESVLKLEAGGPIRLAAEQFARLAAAFFAELERKFLQATAPAELLSSLARVLRSSGPRGPHTGKDPGGLPHRQA